MLAIWLFVGFTITYSLIFTGFAGPESAVESCFKIGFSFGLVCALIVGAFFGRRFWLQYSASEQE